MTAGPTIFIIDDDEAVRDSLGTLLEAHGWTVEAYGSAEAFLAGFDPRRAGCLLVDVRMPGMDGLALQEHLAARRIDLPVIVVTGHADVPLAVRAMKAGAVDFIEKPYSVEAIVNAVHRALDRALPAAKASPVADAAAARLAQLTPRERDVLEQLVVGHPNKVIAHHLQISPRTVEIYRARVMDKMGASSLSHLVRMALAAGIEPKTP
jgi:two-component system response regulator FixJ